MCDDDIPHPLLRYYSQIKITKKNTANVGASFSRRRSTLGLSATHIEYF